MIALCSIASKVWRTVGAENGNCEGITKEDIGYLDYQVKRWLESLPEPLRYDHFTAGGAQNERLRIILYLRANCLQTHIYRPVLHSVTSIMRNRAQAQIVLHVARDTILVLSRLNQHSAMYYKSQTLFNPFLTTALAVLLLIASHAPALFVEQARKEFHLALDLLRGFSEGSRISGRLWRIISALQEIGPELGLVTYQDPLENTGQISDSCAEDPSYTTAPAITRIEIHHVDVGTLCNHNNTTEQHSWPFGFVDMTPNSSDDMFDDFINLFEAEDGYRNTSCSAKNPSHELLTTSGAYAMTTPARMTDPGETSVSEPLNFGSENELSWVWNEISQR